MRSLIDIIDFSVEEIDELCRTACDIIAHPENYREACKYKTLATLFFEPSTRTRLSFEAAMLELGGNVLGFSEASSSSASKGESVADTTKIVSGYANIIAMRHPREGAALVGATNALIPLINAGDGAHAHPTQTLTDLLTLYREKGRFDNLTVAFCGDLKYGRTVHSFIAALSRYENIHIILVSPEELAIPDYIKEEYLSKMSYVEVRDLEDALADADVLYMTRIQRERFSDPEEYERLKNCYCLTTDKMTRAKATMSVLHPLPRVNEISVAVDDDPRAAYFRQAYNGKYIRMALILKLLRENDGERFALDTTSLRINENPCQNPKCISHTEQELARYLTRDIHGNTRCLWCESVQK